MPPGINAIPNCAGRSRLAHHEIEKKHFIQRGLTSLAARS
jgi:hypothetical protein